MHFFKVILMIVSFVAPFCSLAALTTEDQNAIQQAIQKYTSAWNQNQGKGFANDFAENADFINIFGMVFSGRTEIEERHVQILQTFLKGSILEIQDVKLREIQPGVVSAIVKWNITGFHISSSPSEREGIFSHLFVYRNGSWTIEMTQNTLIALK